ncbi:hypothetical protein F2Q70_00026719 [Brassica cretica]|uniref:DUF4283 domain-containing protein n=1 Tax=Brassica cretica TaxID=69181 RepID=A0A8S9LBW4_BRACR|nr:hypothetical protein F2Q70_00026719 [Brassica cretica]
MRENPWFPGNSASAFNPQLLTTGSSSPVTAPTVSSSSLSTTPIEVPTATPTPLASSVATVSRSGGTVQLNLENFKILPPKFSSPIQTNKASRNPPPLPPSLPKNSKHIVSPYCYPETPIPEPQIPTNKPPTAPSLVEKIRKSEDKSLRRLAPATFSETGRPRMLIPDSVFQKGAELHKDFIICYFNGRPPPFNHIQSVLNHLWGKGWSSSASTTSPPLETIQIWAHLTGIPLHLRHQEGLSLVAGLVGEPKETDDFTLNLVSLTLSHVKVDVDLTKPLPSVVEFTRESGEVVEVMVSYPWVPPTCSHCKELRHIMKNCLLLPPPPKNPPPSKRSSKAAASKDKATVSPTPNPPTDIPKTHASSSGTPAAVVNSPEPCSTDPRPSASPSVPSSDLTKSASLPPSHHIPSLNPFVSPSPIKDAPLLNPSSIPTSPFNLSTSIIPLNFSSPPSPPEYPKKRPRPCSSNQSFPSFIAQLIFFSSSSFTPPPTVPSNHHLSSKPFAL